MIKQIKIIKLNAQMILRSSNKILQTQREELLKFNLFWMNQSQSENTNKPKKNLNSNGELRLKQKLMKLFKREINKRVTSIKDKMKTIMQFLLLLQ